MNIDTITVRDRTDTTGHGLPDTEEIARLLASVARPFVIASDRELSVLRRGLTKPGWKRSLYLQDPPEAETKLAGAGLLCVANRWLAKAIRIPERGGQYHNFFCEDGSLLDFKDVSGDGYRCPECGRTYAGDKYDTAYGWFKHFDLATGCLALGLVYQIDRDPECADKAIEILLKYAASYPGTRTSRKEGGMLEQSLDEAAWIIMLAQAYDLVYHSKSISYADRTLIEGRLFRAAAGAFSALDSDGIWEAYHASALGVIGCALKDPRMVREGAARVISQMESELDESGLWPESIHTHHFFALTAYIHLAEACCRIGINLFDEDTSAGRRLKGMFLAPIAYAYPSFQTPAAGDGWFNSPLPMALYEVAFRRWNDPAFAWVLRTGYGFSMNPVNKEQVKHRDLYTRASLYAFLFGRDLPGRTRTPRLESSDFKGPGLVALRADEGSMITFDYGQAKTMAMARRDQLNFTFYASDKLMIADYGTPGWGSNVTDYYKSTAGHNTVVVDGRCQQPVTAPLDIVFRPGIFMQCVQAQSESAYPGVTHKRHIMLIGNFAIVLDELDSPDEHAFDWLLHSEGRLVESAPVVAPAQGVSKYFSDVQSLGEHTDSLLKWEFESCGLAGWFMTETAGSVITASGLTETAARASSVLDLRQTGRTARYVSILYPYRTDTPPTIERFGKSFKIVCGDTVDWVYLSKAPGEHGSSEIESDASLAIVREVGGKMAACGICHGSYVTLRGEQILWAADRFERAEVRMEGRNPVINYDGPTGDFFKLKCHSRAMRVNGHRISASCFDGTASIRITGVLAK